MTLRALVLGAAAGGGLPQWNCRAECSASVWRGDLRPATQSSLAVSAGSDEWVLLNASPDLRSQILATPQLQPRADPGAGGVALRNTPIRSVVLTNGDVDHIAGLLTMRESQPFTLWMTPAIAAVLDANPVFEVLNRAVVERRTVALGETFAPAAGLEITLFAVPGKVALYLEGETVETDLIGEQTVGAALSDGTSTACYVPGCARMSEDLARRLDGAPLVFFDGTVFHDDEMIRAGVGRKTGGRMGHMAMAGPEGSLAAFANLDIGRKIYVHLNNTNPVWLPDSPERAEVEAAGWEVAHDGMEVVL